MKTLTILKNGVITHGPSQFDSLELLNEHLARHEGMKSYGEPAHTKEVTISPAVLDENNEVIVPELTDIVEVPADYEVIIEDVTDLVAQAAVNSEALQYLASTDYLIIREFDSGVPCPSEIKALRQAARESIK